MKTEESAEAGGMEVDAPSSSDVPSDVVKTEKSVDQLSPDQQAQQSTIEKLTQILSGTKSIYFHLQVFVKRFSIIVWPDKFFVQNLFISFY